ncbi:hypothetical protein HPP92_012753 [Vanilla planifolia]|uniref:Reverse transcriptase domain-containing protein n=1 Tax=Vanilla planifolia TaxID=51239 RepID=A0A835UVU6_VANPL|nr:hypothetical protein HPP92_012753 [Vanilla planifolia]
MLYLPKCNKNLKPSRVLFKIRLKFQLVISSPAALVVVYSMLSGLGPRRVLPSIILPFFISTARWVSEVVPSRLPADLETLILDQYRNGKFCDLLCSAIAKPSFLLAACRNLSPDGSSTSLDSISRRISINDLGRELRVGSFDVESSCAKLLPSRKKGAPLILPSLKLKVVIEAVRMALDIVYEKRFATFAYGGRSGMGRHTAVRYLKDAVLNPSWWFHVVFIKQTVDFQRLKILLAEKIEDDALIGIIERLFLSGAMSVEVGGLDMGRGFPQESNLNAVLVNIYLSGLDKEIQDIRSLVHRSHPRCKELEREQDSMVFHKPVRVYAVRYLDELLIVTSGSKLLTMDIKDRILTYVEDNMGMKVDKLQTSIHSAVSEKMDFLGLELQAVPPSILHPPMSEKAMRARKKYLKQKLAKALELKNARETRRKKLGMKILKHVFKKLKRVGEFKIDFPIESEVREVFRTWGGEVVVEYMKSREDCRDWHRMLTSGDFLSLKRVRDLLPGSLVEAYDQFQENVDKYFMSNRVNNQIRGKEKDEVEEGMRYAKRTVEDLTKLCMRVNAPIELVRKSCEIGWVHKLNGTPQANQVASWLG